MIHTDRKRNDKIADSLMSLIKIFHIMKNYSEKSGMKMLPLDPRYSVLGFLLKEDLTMSELGKRLFRSKPNMTAIINVMIQEKMVRRESDPEDRRIVRISITARGKSYLMARKKSVRESIAENLSRLDDRDLDTLYESLENINRIAAKLERD